MVVERRDVDAMLPQGQGNGIHFFVDEDEVPGDRGLPIRRRLEVHHCRHAHGGQQRPPHRGDRFRAGYGDLEHAAANLSPRTSEHLLDLLCVESRAGGDGGSGTRAAQGRAAGRQRLAQSLRHLDRVPMPLVVHVHHVRRHVIEVVVDGSDLEPPAEEAGHHGLHFLIEQDEIAHDHRLVSHLLERRVGSEGEPSLHRDTPNGDGEIGPWHPDAEDVAGLNLARLAERLLYRLPVGV